MSTRSRANPWFRRVVPTPTETDTALAREQLELCYGRSIIDAYNRSRRETKQMMAARIFNETHTIQPLE